MGFSIDTHGSFTNLERSLNRLISGDIYRSLEQYGRAGVDALARATPKESGATALGWEYRITNDRGSAGIEWYNTHAPYGEVVAILIQYGHGTGTGGYVRGYDYINPAIRPIFDAIIASVIKEVSI